MASRRQVSHADVFTELGRGDLKTRLMHQLPLFVNYFVVLRKNLFECPIEAATMETDKRWSHTPCTRLICAFLVANAGDNTVHRLVVN